MKKFLSVFLIILVCLSAFAAQQTYTYSSPEVQALLTLSQMTGTPVLSMTYPVSSSFMLESLSRMDTSALSGPALDMYFSLKSSISEKDYLISTEDGKTGISTDLRVLGAEIWKGENILPYKDRLALASADAVLDFSDYFTGFFRFNFGKNYSSQRVLSGDVYMDSILKPGFTEGDYVTKSYVSLGYDKINFIIGRDLLSAGSGRTGNLELGENQLYQDFAKFSALSYPFSYDFTLAVYDAYDENGKLELFDLSGPVKAVYIHRFSITAFKRAAFSLYEGAMAYGDGIFSDPRVLNPFLFIHNTFTYATGKVNNFFGFEAEVNLPKNLKLDVQAMIDQLKLSTEEDTSGDNSFGVLANLSGSWNVGEGILSAYAEVVYNNKALYLKEQHSPYPRDNDLAENPWYYELDLITGINRYKEEEFAYLGYGYGGDLFAAGAGASYLWKGHTFSADLLFLSKGEYGIGSGEQRYLRGGYVETGDRVNSLNFTVGAKGTFFDGLDYAVKAGVLRSSFQFALSVSVRPLEFFK